MNLVIWVLGYLILGTAALAIVGFAMLTIAGAWADWYDHRKARR